MYYQLIKNKTKVSIRKYFIANCGKTQIKVELVFFFITIKLLYILILPLEKFLPLELNYEVLEYNDCSLIGNF
jgi:hypothetical protein